MLDTQEDKRKVASRFCGSFRPLTQALSSLSTDAHALYSGENWTLSLNQQAKVHGRYVFLSAVVSSLTSA